MVEGGGGGSGWREGGRRDGGGGRREAEGEERELPKTNKKSAFPIFSRKIHATTAYHTQSKGML